MTYIGAQIPAFAHTEENILAPHRLIPNIVQADMCTLLLRCPRSGHIPQKPPCAQGGFLLLAHCSGSIAFLTA
jgi:hypothetical protein